MRHFLQRSVWISDTVGSDIGCKVVSGMINGKTPEEIRTLFNIVTEITPEDEVRGVKRFLMFS